MGKVTKTSVANKLDKMWSKAILSTGCHLFKNNSFHKNPEWGHFWLEENRWEDLAYINCVMYEIKKWTLEEMIEHLDKLKALNDELYR